MPETETLLLPEEKELISDLAYILDIDTEDVGEITDKISELEKEDLPKIILLQKAALVHVKNLQTKIRDAFNIEEVGEIKKFRYQLDLALDIATVISEQKEKNLGSLDPEDTEKIKDEEDSVFMFNLRVELGIEENDDIEIVDAIMEQKEIEKVVLVKIASLGEVERLQTELDNAIAINNIGKIKNIRLQLDTALNIALAACIRKEEVTS